MSIVPNIRRITITHRLFLSRPCHAIRFHGRMSSLGHWRRFSSVAQNVDPRVWGNLMTLAPTLRNGLPVAPSNAPNRLTCCPKATGLGTKTSTLRDLEPSRNFTFSSILGFQVTEVRIVFRSILVKSTNLVANLSLRKGSFCVAQFFHAPALKKIVSLFADTDRNPARRKCRVTRCKLWQCQLGSMIPCTGFPVEFLVFPTSQVFLSGVSLFSTFQATVPFGTVPDPEAGYW